MEGVSNEAASIAGHQRLDNLCWIYDNNHITIDGHTEITYERRRRRPLHGLRLERDPGRRRQRPRRCSTRAFENFREEDERPTLIIVDSHIGYGSPHKQDTAEAHGEPLGEEEVRETKRAYGWPEDAEFLVPDGVYEHFAEGIGARGAELRAEWEELLAGYRRRARSSRPQIDPMQRRELPEGWDADIPSFDADEKGMATRKASNKVANAVARAACPGCSPAPPT